MANLSITYRSPGITSGEVCKLNCNKKKGAKKKKECRKACGKKPAPKPVSGKPTKAPTGSTESKTVNIGNIGPIDLIATESEKDSATTVELGGAGTLEVKSTGVTFTPPGTDGEPLTIPLPDEADITPGTSLAIAEFLLLQLESAAQISGAQGSGVRRLDSPGCDLFPDAPCNLGCCAVHDRCYAENGCTALSWARTVCEPFLAAGIAGLVSLGPLGTLACTASLLTISGGCSQCNNVAIACIATGCSGLADPISDEVCYDNQCNTFTNCPGTCDFLSLEDEACCGCVTPGESCNAPETCGNGVCDFGENLSNCFVDCAFNTCPDEGDFDCGGTCVNTKTDSDNCGACGVKCPSGTPCILGRCSTPFSISWDTNAGGLIGSGGWTVFNDGLRIRFEIEDSGNCGGSNENIQSGTATATIQVSETYELRADIDGVSELQDTGFENMAVQLDGTDIVQATSRDLDQECAMGPSIVDFLQEQPFILTPGEHTFSISFTTADELYHVGAFYELNLIFNEATDIPN